MGAFFLFRNDVNVDVNSVKEHFSDLGFKDPLVRRFKDLTLLLYRKQLIDVKNFAETKDHGIYVVGTLVYKQKNYPESIELLFRDLIDGNFDHEKLFGTFWILFKHNDDLLFFCDKAGLQNIYYLGNFDVLSSSFLAILQCLHRKFSLNKNAITEILLTGSLIGPDTIITEIDRLENDSKINNPSIRYLNFTNKEQVGFCNKTYSECLDEQIDLLREYFINISNCANAYNCISGLTGGFDSRLLMGLAEPHLNRIDYYSHWRSEKSIEFEIAQKLTAAINKELITIPVTAPLAMSEEEALECLEDALFYNDGQIRMHSYWHEEYNTRGYAQKLYKNYSFGFHAVGGEQYRNHEKMIMPFWNYLEWIKNDLVFRYVDNPFFSDTDEREFIEHISEKIVRKLAVIPERTIDRLFIKRYYNEIYNLANRNIKTNSDNQLVFFLSPFTEYNLSHHAYEIIPHLGVSFNFQAAMIRKLNPSLAGIKSDYGFDFSRKTPIKFHIITIIEEIIPKKTYRKFYNAIKKNMNDDLFIKYSQRFNFMNELQEITYDLRIPIDVSKIKRSRFLGPLLISLGYFLKRFSSSLGY